VGNTYIRKDVERDLYRLNVQNIPDFVNDVLRRELKRIKEIQGGGEKDV